MRELPDTPESEEGAEAQCCRRMGIYKSVAYEEPVLVGLKHELLFQYHASHPIHCRRDVVAIHLADILMPVGTVMVALIFMESEVKLRPMLHHGDIER